MEKADDVDIELELENLVSFESTGKSYTASNESEGEVPAFKKESEQSGDTQVNKTDVKKFM